MFCICFPCSRQGKVPPSLRYRDRVLVLRHEHPEVQSDPTVLIPAHRNGDLAHPGELPWLFSDPVSVLKTGTKQGKVPPRFSDTPGTMSRQRCITGMMHADQQSSACHQATQLYLRQILSPWDLFDPNVQY